MSELPAEWVTLKRELWESMTRREQRIARRKVDEAIAGYTVQGPAPERRPAPALRDASRVDRATPASPVATRRGHKSRPRGTNPRAQGTNPRAQAVNPRALSDDAHCP